MSWGVCERSGFMDSLSVCLKMPDYSLLNHLLDCKRDTLTPSTRSGQLQKANQKANELYGIVPYGTAR